MQRQPAFLVLQNGTVMKGFSMGSPGEAVGEMVFSTGMTGYLETLTDKSYCGQIITQTFPLIGNYGVIPKDFEGPRVSARGYIVRQWCQEPSNFRNEGDLDAFLFAQGVVGLCGIDTRALTRILREQGSMNGMICQDPSHADLDYIKAYRVHDAVEQVSVGEPQVYNPQGRYSVALLDFGYKQNILRELTKRDCKVTVLPHNTTAAQVLALGVDAVMLSNGPGDPADNTFAIAQIKQLTQSGLPIFGICLGHQLLALAFGFQTEKLKYGHRGANQPAKDLLTGRTYITSQNHGYAVKKESIDPNIAKLWFVNANDGTCEGILYHKKPICSVQFHPEGCAGPQDTGFLFDQFLKEITRRAG